MAPEEDLKHAKKEMQEAPVGSNDPELDSRLFHNVSLFQRSEAIPFTFIGIYFDIVFQIAIISGAMN